MLFNSMINQCVFREVASSSSSLTIVPPSNTKKLLIMYDNIIPTSLGAAVLIRTAPSSGVFATSGYLSGTHDTEYNSNGWNNQNLTNGFMITTAKIDANHTCSGFAYITNLNTNNKVICTGEFSALALGSLFTVIASGLSPTTFATMIRVQASSSTILSGEISAYTIF